MLTILFSNRHTCLLTILLSLSFLSQAADNSVLLQPVKEYRGVEILKRDVTKDTEYVLPLGNLKRIGRSWQPSNSTLVLGDMTTSLYKLSRTSELIRVYQHYSAEISNNAETLFECSGRDCGNSNAWANNFFQDYRLYGVDDNQFLLVTKTSEGSTTNSLYQVLYINRRGAGDVMVHLDRIQTKLKLPVVSSELIALQIEINNFSKIRQYIESKPENEKITALVSSEKKHTMQNAILVGQAHIKSIQKSLGTRLSNRVVFINIASFGRAEFGENLVTLLKADDK